MPVPMLRTGREEGRFGRVFLLALAVYFLLLVVIRVSQPGGLALDEAEQVYSAQRLLVGYDSQPPLYSWLQWLAFKVFGVSLLGLSALKNGLLFTLYLAMFLLAQPLIGPMGAAAASASLILFPPIGWESQIDRTHSVLATTIAALALWAYYAMLRRPHMLWRALLGLLLGLGMLAKYNFSIFIAGMMAASLFVPEHRRLVWQREVWVTVLVAVLVVLPHGLWFIGHLDSATADTLYKMGVTDRADGYFERVAHGLVELAQGIVTFSALFVLIFAAAARPFWKHARLQTDLPAARFFLWVHAAALACVFALVVAGYLSNLKGRWLQPFLFALPLATLVLVPGAAKALVYRRLVIAAAIVAILTLAALTARPLVPPAVLGRTMHMHQPYPELAAEVAQRFPDVDLIVAQDPRTAGNLRFHQPRFPTMLLNDVPGGQPLTTGRILILMRAGGGTAWQRRMRDAYPDAVVAEQGALSVRSGKGSEEVMRFEYAVLLLGGR